MSELTVDHAQFAVGAIRQMREDWVNKPNIEIRKLALDAATAAVSYFDEECDSHCLSIDVLAQWEGMMPWWTYNSGGRLILIKPTCDYCGNDLMEFQGHAPDCKWLQPNLIESIYGYMTDADILDCIDAEDDPHFSMFEAVLKSEQDDGCEWVGPRTELIIGKSSYYNQRLIREYYDYDNKPYTPWSGQDYGFDPHC